MATERKAISIELNKVQEEGKKKSLKVKKKTESVDFVEKKIRSNKAKNMSS